MIRAVIFDFGGVLVRTEDHGGRRKWEGRLGLPEGGLSGAVFDSEVSARASVGQLPETAVWEHVARTLRLDDAGLALFRRDFFAGDRLDAALVQFIQGLRPAYKTAILSNAWDGARRAFNEVFGLGAAVDEMIVSAEEGVAKPDARIYRIAAARLGVEPDEAVFVDDMAENVAGARAVGMFGVQFLSTPQTIADVRKFLDGAGIADR